MIYGSLIVQYFKLGGSEMLPKKLWSCSLNSGLSFEIIIFLLEYFVNTSMLLVKRYRVWPLQIKIAKLVHGL